MLEVRNLVKRYKISSKAKTKDVVALNDVSITFPDKGLIFLLGKSGSGKSTLLNAIGGLDTFDSGEIIIKGKSSKAFSQSDFDSYRNTFIGFIFQEYNVLEEFSVAKNLSLAIELQGKTPTKELINELLESVEMQEYAKRRPNQLSGGQKQRVAIARALIKNPEIIMADEPTGALDSNTGRQVMDTLKKLSKEKLVIIVSHDREFAEIYGDRIIELKDGKIISDVTKKEVSSHKTESGISIIDNELIHIKKGQKFTKEDVEKICKTIMDNAERCDTIISLSDRANEDIKKANSITDNGNKEVFRSTEPADISANTYNGTDLKLIKSKLKFKDSFKMGASALKNKVGKLVFTILLSFIAFGMFGIIDTFSSFDRAAAVSHTVTQFNKKTVSLLKETEGEYSNDTTPFKDSDIILLHDKFPDIELKKVTGSDINFGNNYYSNSYNKTIYINELSGSQSSSNPANTPYYSGMICVTEGELAKYGLSLVAGRLPSNTNDKEICISKHIYDCFVKSNPNSGITYDKILTQYKQCNIGYSYDNTYTIVGIIDDGVDYSEYMNIETAQISSDYMLQQKISRELDFGFSNMIYVNQSKYDKMLNKPLNVNTQIFANDTNLHYSLDTERTKSIVEDFYNYRNDSLISYLSSYGYYYKGGDLYSSSIGQYITLGEDEILLHNEQFDRLFGTDSYESRVSKLSESTPLSIQVISRQYNSNLNQYDETTEATLTVVGFHNAWNTNIVTTSDKHLGLSSMEIKLTYGSETTDYYNYTVNTLTNSALISGYDPSNFTATSYFTNNIQYYKNGGTLVSNGIINELGLNEIILPSHYLTSYLGSGEELYTLIDEGVEIKLTSDYEGKDVLITFKLVGISSNDIYMSEETTRGAKFKDIFSGFDYAIALLSDDTKMNEKFVNYCEKFSKDKIKYTIQIGATPILDNFGDILNSISEVFLYVGIGFAVFASLLLMNFISTSISYKKREIGILRALGARGSDVFGIFFNESLVIAAINFVLATIATVVTCVILNNVIITRLGLDLVLLSVGIRQIALMLGISILTAFISSFLPVLKIARKKPIDAINNR